MDDIYIIKEKNSLEDIYDHHVARYNIERMIFPQHKDKFTIIDLNKHDVEFGED
jgi:hypothetical protein